MGPAGEIQAGKDYATHYTLHVSIHSVVIVEFESCVYQKRYCKITMLRCDQSMIFQHAVLLATIIVSLSQCSYVYMKL